MRRRLTRGAVLGVLLLLVAASVLAAQNQDRPAQRDRPAAAAGTPASTPAPAPSGSARPTASPSPPPAAATPDPSDLEDNHAREREESRPRRPLRDLLPIELAGTRIEPVLRHSDTVRIIPGPRGRRAARAIYDRARAATGDRTTYTIRWGQP